jgi:hypothetical protein
VTPDLTKEELRELAGKLRPLLHPAWLGSSLEPHRPCNYFADGSLFTCFSPPEGVTVADICGGCRRNRASRGRPHPEWTCPICNGFVGSNDMHVPGTVRCMAALTEAGSR